MHFPFFFDILNIERRKFYDKKINEEKNEKLENKILNDNFIEFIKLNDDKYEVCIKPLYLTCKQIYKLNTLLKSFY